jgi:hypothetical protein
LDDPIVRSVQDQGEHGLAAFDRKKMKSAADVIQAADAELYEVKEGRER